MAPNISGSEGNPSAIPCIQRFKDGSVSLTASKVSKVMRPEGEMIACSGALIRISPNVASARGAENKPAS